MTRTFGEVKAVDGIDLRIRDGEFFTLLGPSGSGKTTCLRMIAGFDRPTEGTIYLHGVDVTKLPPYERDVNTVFQDYALFPHMNVGENIAYGLKIRGVSKAEQKRRVEEMLALVQLSGFEHRKPTQLSGGQRQRVALARALINQPRVLLLDEPLGALDLKLRQQMQVELKSLQQRLGITFVFVTHDQEEALSMSDRVAVFNQGKIEQIGSPMEIYERPQTAFVANFVGVSNMIAGALAQRLLGVNGVYALRPEKIHLCRPDTPLAGDWIAVEGTVFDVDYLGLFTRYRVHIDSGEEIVVVQQNLMRSTEDITAREGDRVQLRWLREHMLEMKGV
ncbi:putative ABC transporter ATP-binding protein [Caldilinea aerophila DSM 14535 = NBRC 104270]|uniref:Putative ABC transporter ATP-binding protein n=1 Tax=Caldilinea aerophila (strain DSM 14535 / JCM 11387 / NBRC 104270 / STL-6-O1) TaxID=926550 RepID=I0I3Y5_CALAS|nr:putative ABC transporter ATP-binding protein [Caldilinea aerophila DSM 14535 = NBRC 104270]